MKTEGRWYDGWPCAGGSGGGDEGSMLEDGEVRIPLGECVLDSPNCD